MAERLPLIESTSDDNAENVPLKAIRSRRSASHLASQYSDIFQNSNITRTPSGTPPPPVLRSRSGSSGTLQQALNLRGVTPGTVLEDDEGGVEVALDPTKDTLQGIAVRFHTSVAKLKQLNKLSTDQEFYSRVSLKVPRTGYGAVTGRLVDVEPSAGSTLTSNETERKVTSSGGYKPSDINHEPADDNSKPETRQFLLNRDKEIEQLRQNVADSLAKKSANNKLMQPKASNNTISINQNVSLLDISNADVDDNDVAQLDCSSASHDNVVIQTKESIDNVDAADADSSSAAARIITILPRRAQSRPYDKMMSWRALISAVLGVVALSAVIVFLIIIDNEKESPPN